MVDCGELDPAMTSLQDVDLSPPATMNFPRGGGDPLAGPAAVNEIQAQVVEQAALGVEHAGHPLRHAVEAPPQLYRIAG